MIYESLLFYYSTKSKYIVCDPKEKKECVCRILVVDEGEQRQEKGNADKRGRGPD